MEISSSTVLYPLTWRVVQKRKPLLWQANDHCHDCSEH